VAAVRDRLDELGEDTSVVVVMFSDPAELAAYSDLGLVALTDPDRRAYRAFGLGRGSVGRVWGWKAARRYGEIVRADGLAGLRRPTEDTLQLGGDFVIDADGSLVYGFWSEGPDDRPTVDRLIVALGP
jgi:hypothetical protein